MPQSSTCLFAFRIKHHYLQTFLVTQRAKCLFQWICWSLYLPLTYSSRRRNLIFWSHSQCGQTLCTVLGSKDQKCSQQKLIAMTCAFKFNPKTTALHAVSKTQQSSSCPFKVGISGYGNLRTMSTDKWATSKSTQLSTKVWVKLLFHDFIDAVFPT